MVYLNNYLTPRKQESPESSDSHWKSLFYARYCSLLHSKNGIPQAVLDEAWETCVQEGLLLFNVNLAIIRQELSSLTLKDPYHFWRGEDHGGMKHDLLQSAVSLTRPVAAMYLAFPAGESQVHHGHCHQEAYQPQ